jgi:hypothetical protein
MIRKTLQIVAGAFLVFGSLGNLLVISLNTAGLPSRAEEDITMLESQYLPVKSAIWSEHPAPMRIGYMTAVTLNGKPLDDAANLRWNQLRYVMIPRKLQIDTKESYVLGDFKKDEPLPPVPENFVMVYDSGNGMILYRQKQAR